MLALADDLTSALDALGPWAERRFDACVLLNDVDMFPVGAVLGIDLNTRYAETADAFSRFFEAGRRHCTHPLLLKTIDSTLRGRPAAELEGLVSGSGRRRVVVAPAFPAAGRITRSGRQYVDGIPIERSRYAQDLRAPVISSDLHDLFSKLEGAEIDIRDAESDADLDLIVASIEDVRDVIWVGSPGLAAALARRYASSSNPKALMPLPRAQRVLTVVGSMHPSNATQVEHIRAEGGSIIRLETADAQASVATLRQDLLQSANICLVAPASPCDPSEVLDLIAHAVAATSDLIDGLVLTGGETARVVLERLGASELRLSGEVSAGVPFGVAVCGDRLISFATKAGGFGTADTLQRCGLMLEGTLPQGIAA
jgi:D-threonate/D-erythronate kinase